MVSKGFWGFGVLGVNGVIGPCFLAGACVAVVRTFDPGTDLQEMSSAEESCGFLASAEHLGFFCDHVFHKRFRVNRWVIMRSPLTLCKCELSGL